jgi:hypothetical protein
MTELIIGRESGEERPRLAVQHEGTTSYFGKPGSVPRSVSRKHCRVTMDNGGGIFLEDITENNVMFIDGKEYKKKGQVRKNDLVELGADRYRLPLEEIVNYFSVQRTYHIGHLRKVQEDYQNARQEMQIRQGRLNSLSTLPGILSMGSMALFFGTGNGSNLRQPFLIAAVVFMILFGVIRWISAATTPKKNKELENEYRAHYRCPNPACDHFLGQTHYDELLSNKTCPYCKAKYEE